MIVKLKDGGIEEIWSDEEHYSGCPTCDYGSQYINNLRITLTKYVISARVNQMYEYRFSSGDMMKIILPNYEKILEMTEKEFAEWFRKAITEYKHKEIDYNEPEFTFEVSEIK